MQWINLETKVAHSMMSDEEGLGIKEGCSLCLLPLGTEGAYDDEWNIARTEMINPLTDLSDDTMVLGRTHMESNNRKLDNDCRKQVSLDVVSDVRSAFSADNSWRVALYLTPHVQEYLGNAMLVLDGKHWLAVEIRDRCGDRCYLYWYLLWVLICAARGGGTLTTSFT